MRCHYEGVEGFGEEEEEEEEEGEEGKEREERRERRGERGERGEEEVCMGSSLLAARRSPLATRRSRPGPVT